MSCTCNSSPCCCTAPSPACLCPPSPVPPWERTTQSPLVQYLFDSGTLLLDPDITYLRSALPGADLAVILPDGSFLKQMKRIYIQADMLATTRKWVVTGKFAGGYTTITLNNLASSALLEYDGSAWQILAGNSIPA